jgi:hypothetical protein
MDLNRRAALASAISTMVGSAQSAEARTRRHSRSDDLTRPIRVSDNGRFLSKPNGEPFFWLADTAWPLFARLDREEADHYLRDRAEKRFTVIQAVVMGGPWETMTDPNRYGALPLVEMDPARPNEAWFQHVDWIVDRAARHGLRMALLPVWGLSLINFGALFNPEKAATFGRFLGERYRRRGVIWVLGGDTIPMWWARHARGAPIIDHRPIYDAMARGIIEGEGGDPFITYHPCGVSFSGTPRPRTSLYFHDRDWLDMNMVQTSHFRDPTAFLEMVLGDFAWDPTKNYEPIAEEYASTPIRPVLDGETRYENEPAFNRRDGGDTFWTAFDNRTAIYHALFAGACGHTYGNNAVHQFFDPRFKPALEQVAAPWQVELHSEAAGQMRHARALMMSRPYFTRVPDQTLLVGDAGEGNAHINSTRDARGSYAMVYIPDGRAAEVRLHAISGPRAKAWWFNPRSGQAQSAGDGLLTSADHTFRAPTSGSDQDWILVLDSEIEDFGPPGAAERS